MKLNIIKFSLIASLFLTGVSSCSKFEAINTNPVAASGDQVQVEYFINNSIVGAQQDPHIAERVFVLYWKTAARHHLSTGIAGGNVDDGWSSDYWRYASGWLNSINTAVQVGEDQLSKGTNKIYTNNLVQIARIWRAYLLSELSDNFGPVAIDAFKGINPQYVSVKDVYYYLLAELKDANSKIDASLPKPTITNEDKISFSYHYDYAKWKKFANSLRMRFAMRIAEVDATKAKQEFEEAVATNDFIKDAADVFDVQEKDGWDPLTGVMSRPWNSQILSATLNNIYLNLGGIKSADQGLPADMQSYIKPANYIGLRFPDHYPSKTNDPTVGYRFDGLPEVIDPRAYKAFIIPGWFSNPDMANNVGGYDVTARNLLDAAGQVQKTIESKYTWNAAPVGDWGAKGTRNQVRNWTGANPMLAKRFRTSTNKRIFFANWESYFLIAEAAVKGWTVPMSGKAAYEEGIKANFAYWGVSAHAPAYLASTSYNRNGTSVSWDHTTEPPNTYTMEYVDGMTGTPGTVTISYPVNNIYKNGTVRNDLLTKIITQKYISMVPWLPLEAWSDHRRLGLPFFENVAIENPLPNLPALTSNNYTTNQVNFFPQRLKYPTALVVGSPDGYNQAVGLLGGADNVLTPLWWAKKQ